jgi:N-acyl-D-amino-acid deacylase
LQQRDDTVNSLSDGGAHCGTICDAASPTFMLQHWARDRTRGTITLENAIKRQCKDTARLYGLNDRGVLKPGYLADINVIDMANIKLGKPWLAFDLPAGGKRLLQKAEGYDYTIKSGRVTFKSGDLTDARPGGLIRGPHQVDRVSVASRPRSRGWRMIFGFGEPRRRYWTTILSSPIQRALFNLENSCHYVSCSAFR